MRLAWFRRRKKNSGSTPKGMEQIALYSNPATAYFYQEKQVFPWANAPAHEQRSALINCWTGNQLPGMVNFIPGVPGSYDLWNVPTSYANTLKNQQFNKGLNIQNETVYQQADLLQQAITNWQNRVNY